jgi:hypothetical protein
MIEKYKPTPLRQNERPAGNVRGANLPARRDFVYLRADSRNKGSRLRADRALLYCRGTATRTLVAWHGQIHLLDIAHCGPVEVVIQDGGRWGIVVDSVVSSAPSQARPLWTLHAGMLLVFVTVPCKMRPPPCS